MASEIQQEPTIGLKWHVDIDKVANFGNDHYFALINNTPWTISITSGIAGNHKNGLNFTRDVEPSDCYVHVCSKLGWTFSAGGTFCVKADSKDVNDVQFIDFALSNPIVTGRKIRTIPVKRNEYGAKAWKFLAKSDTLKTFTYHDQQCVVKGEIQPGQSGCFVWKFCIQVLEGIQVKKQPQQWSGDSNVQLSVAATGIGTLSYRWRKEGENIDTVKYSNCSGEDSATITISPVTSKYEGSYSCAIEDETGQCAESDPIRVKVPAGTPSPEPLVEVIKITKQPQTLKFDSNSATIGVCATGPGTLSYTWMKDGEAITPANYPYCSGFDMDTLTISPFSALYEGDYHCVIRNQDGLSVESEVTSLKHKGLSRSPMSFKSKNPIRHAAQKLQKKAEEWEENFVVQAAKRMANLMKEMDKYTTHNEFDEKELSDLLSRIIEISKEMVKVANRAAEACPNRLPKQDVLKQVKIIELAGNFLEVLASVNASRLKEGDAAAKEKLTRNATQLLDAVCVIIQAIDTATITLSDEAREKLDLPKWVKLAKHREVADAQKQS